MTDCIFCKIIKGEIPSKKVLENEKIVVFHDINPAAPVHLLIVPKNHTSDILSLAEHVDSAEILKAVLDVIPEIARIAGVDQKGFRLINNCGKEGGQTIDHLHFHLLGGRDLGEKLL